MMSPDWFLESGLVACNYCDQAHKTGAEHETRFPPVAATHRIRQSVGLRSRVNPAHALSRLHVAKSPIRTALSLVT